MSIPTRHLLQIVLLAVAYFMAGKLSLLLAIPPGFATPVWPAAGIALAAVMIYGYRVAPGIFAGSFAVNLLVSLNAGGDVLATKTLLVAAGIAAGATLQAVVASCALKHLLPNTTKLSGTRDIAILILVGGALGCLVSGVLGPLTLLAAGVIPASIFALSAVTWWVGDGIGVMLFTPVLLLVANAHVTSLRKFIVSVPVLAFTGLTAMLFFGARADGLQHAQLEFERLAQQITAELRLDLNGYLDVLTANENFMASSENVTHKEFAAFTRDFRRKYPGIQSLAWIPRVTHGERASFEESMRATGLPEYTIYDRTALGNSEPAPPREVYFPVAYFEPREPNLRSAGLDTYGPDGVIGFVRRDALDIARTKGSPRTTGPVSLVQAEGEVGLVVYNPVFRRHATEERDAASEAQVDLLGYVAGVFRVNAMVSKVAAQSEALGMDLQILDRDSMLPSPLLFDSDPNSENAPPGDNTSAAVQYVELLEFAGHRWELFYRQKASAQIANQNWDLWKLLVGAMLLSALFGSFLMVISAGADDDPSLNIDHENPSSAFWLATIAGAFVLFLALLFVRQLDQYALGTATVGTMPLSKLLLAASVLLAVLTSFVVYIATVANHRSMMLRHKTHALLAANTELEEFAYRTSHDLRSPLVSSIALVDLTCEFFAEGDVEQGSKSLKMIEGGLRKLDTLLQDIMMLTRTKNLQEEACAVDLQEVVQSAIEHVAHLPGSESLQIETDINLPGPLYVRRTRIKVIVENLISNGIKYQDPEADQPKLSIIARKQSGRLVLTVEDNGLGIPESQRAKLFSMFSRFHTEVSYGSGLGLYMVRKSADVLGGKIQFEALNPGSRFIFSMRWPLAPE